MRITWVMVFLAACHSADSASKGSTDQTGAPSETGGTTGTTDTQTPPTTTTGSQDGFCGVRRIFNTNCVVCHGSVAPQGGLDLQTDPWAEIVGVSSPVYGEVRVQPGDPDHSLLWRKMDGSQEATQGTVMPPTGRLDTAQATIRQWILDGATEDCGTPGTTTEPEPYHPAGWEDPAVHGMATKFQTETDCRTCHGTDLSGGSSGVSCTSCHGAGWETTCTFCHGGVESSTGAPPEDIDDNADPATITFVPHEVHLAGRITQVFDCNVCHTKPTDALTPGHLFDDPTAGQAEVTFGAGPSSYDATTGTCSNLYCHGNGQGPNGDIVSSASPRTCHGCHADRTTPNLWSQMSGHHEKHLDEGFACSDCHEDAQGSSAIDDPALHVNGTPDVALPQGMTYTAGNQTCDGTCHGERHSNRRW